jgi:hypothetical protein
MELRHYCDIIEAPWLVNGGHGASLRHHKRPAHLGAPRRRRRRRARARRVLAVIHVLVLELQRDAGGAVVGGVEHDERHRAPPLRAAERVRARPAPLIQA